MSFLLPYLKCRDNETSYCTLGSANEESEEMEYENIHKVEPNSPENFIAVEIENHNDDVSYDRTTQLIPNTIQQKQDFKEHFHSETSSPGVSKYLLEEKSNPDKQDEIDTLFHSLAQTVKKLNPYYRAVAKAKVCSIISELEIKNLTHEFVIPDISPYSLCTTVNEKQSSSPSSMSSALLETATHNVESFPDPCQVSAEFREQFSKR